MSEKMACVTHFWTGHNLVVMEFSDSEGTSKQPCPAAQALISIGAMQGGRSWARESRGKTEQHRSFENGF